MKTITLTPGFVKLADLSKVYWQEVSVRLDPSCRSAMEIAHGRIAAAAAGDAAVYGVRGASGVISVYTHVGPFNANKLNLNNGSLEKYPNSSNFKINGFSKVREFYSPDYAVPKPEHRREDYRTTLYWEPNLQLDQNGESKIDFFPATI